MSNVSTKVGEYVEDIVDYSIGERALKKVEYVIGEGCNTPESIINELLFELKVPHTNDTMINGDNVTRRVITLKSEKNRVKLVFDNKTKQLVSMIIESLNPNGINGDGSKYLGYNGEEVKRFL